MRYTVLLVGHCYSEVLCSSIRNKRFVGLPTDHRICVVEQNCPVFIDPPFTATVSFVHLSEAFVIHWNLVKVSF